jgi:hypothetical protein
MRVRRIKPLPSFEWRVPVFVPEGRSILKEPTAYPLYVAEVPDRFLQVLHPNAYPEF